MSAQFPWWGSEKRDHFTSVGTWRFDILDEEDHVVISAPLEIAPLEDIWESILSRTLNFVISTATVK